MAGSQWERKTLERHFIAPLSLYAKRSNPSWESTGGSRKGGGKGRDGGKKGKKGEKDDDKAKKGANNTPDGKPICFRYNSKAGCKKKEKCHFLHVCSRCFQKHPQQHCTVQPAQADTLGQGAG